MNEQFPADLPPHWLVYFAVEDADATAAKAGELGGSRGRAASTPRASGRIAVLGDPNGARVRRDHGDPPPEARLTEA